MAERILPKGYIFIYDDELGTGYILGKRLGKPLKKNICEHPRTGLKYEHCQINNKVNGKIKHYNYSTHRLIALHFIPNPKNYPEVDHINGNSLDNRISNLRWCNRSINNYNKPSSAGATWCKDRKLWRSYIFVDGKQKHLGYFDNQEKAKDTYQNFKKQLLSKKME